MQLICAIEFEFGALVYRYQPQSSPVPAKILPAANQAPHKTEGLPRRLDIYSGCHQQ
jgi:hypothetical protein